MTLSAPRENFIRSLASPSFRGAMDMGDLENELALRFSYVPDTYLIQHEMPRNLDEVGGVAGLSTPSTERLNEIYEAVGRSGVQAPMAHLIKHGVNIIGLETLGGIHNPSTAQQIHETQQAGANIALLGLASALVLGPRNVNPNPFASRFFRFIEDAKAGELANTHPLVGQIVVPKILALEDELSVEHVQVRQDTLAPDIKLGHTDELETRNMIVSTKQVKNGETIITIAVADMTYYLDKDYKLLDFFKEPYRASHHRLRNFSQPVIGQFGVKF